MDWHAQTEPLWEHTCCQTRYWSAARMCDRCGAHAAVVVVGVSIADAMARLHSLEQRPVETESAPRLQASAVLAESPFVNPDEGDESPPPRPRATHPDLERAPVFGLWLFGGLLCALMMIGVVPESERANYARLVVRGIPVVAAPASLLALAVDGWLKHRRSKKAEGLAAGTIAGHWR